MASPGNTIIRPSGNVCVLPDGSPAVFGAGGACMPCCGGSCPIPGPCAIVDNFKSIIQPNGDAAVQRFTGYWSGVVPRDDIAVGVQEHSFLGWQIDFQVVGRVGGGADYVPNSASLVTTSQQLWIRTTPFIFTQNQDAPAQSIYVFIIDKTIPTLVAPDTFVNTCPISGNIARTQMFSQSQNPFIFYNSDRIHDNIAGGSPATAPLTNTWPPQAPPGCVDQNFSTPPPAGALTDVGLTALF